VFDQTNARIADLLEETARFLRARGSDHFRVHAYERAAVTVRQWPEPLVEVCREDGLPGLEALPGVGPSIARAIRELIVRGRLPMLDRLRRETDAEVVLASVPGIGRLTAERLHRELGLGTLEDLETAAHDGRLATLAGFGPKRLSGVRDSLAHRLARVKVPGAPAGSPIPVAELLDVDREYRQKAAAGVLQLIAPRRFNPDHKPWLPVLHTTRGTRKYTAVFSNTARAHRARKTADWVVLYAEDAGARSQHTVITAERGASRGRRVVAGREAEGAGTMTSTAA
jgi:hypothetical protein